MDGIHDLGGRQGFGPVIQTGDPDEQFHEPWEARVRAVVNALSVAPDWSLDWFRHCRELIDPVDYLSRPYFDQWAQTYAAMLVNSGIATVDEVVSGKSAGGAAASVRAPMAAADVPGMAPGAKRYDGDAGAPPIFGPGDAVHTVAHGTSGHTRLPGYARDRDGAVLRHHGAHVFADANAHGEKRFEHLYTVGFDAAELWPEAAGRRERVYLNLWEAHLERR